jgi:hypothetical protein
MGSVARPAARAATRSTGGLLKGAGKVAGGIVNVLESLLGGGASRPAKGSAKDDNKIPLDPGKVPSKDEADKLRRIEQEQQSTRRQKYLRLHSREVPDELQRDADIQRDPTTGRERTRGE